MSYEAPVRLGVFVFCSAVLACVGPAHVLRPAPAGVDAYAQGIDWAQAGDEAVEVLRGYLRVDTTNPPGNEALGTQYLAAQLARDGLEAELSEFAPGRGVLVARLKATHPDGRKPLCLLSHVDVVPAEADTWPEGAGPLSGALREGMVWGRGALDMKGMGALELQVFRWLARRKVPLARDVVLIAEGDEEVSQAGMRQVTGPLWQGLECGHVLNEGGLGVRGLLAPGLTTFGISVGEKGVLWLRLVAQGEAGHGSTPTGERAPTRLVRALERLAARSATPRIPPALYELLRAVGEKTGGLRGFVLQRPALVRAFAVGTLMDKPQTRAGITDTCQVTGFEGRGSAPNVIPSTVSAVLDCRVLPGTTPQALQAELQALLTGVEGVHFEVVTAFAAGESPLEDELYDALARRAVEGRGDAIAGPILSPGYTDSQLAREKGARAYGLLPFEVTPEELAGYHGRDERVSVANVHRGLQVLYRVVLDVAAAPAGP